MQRVPKGSGEEDPIRQGKESTQPKGPFGDGSKESLLWGIIHCIVDLKQQIQRLFSLKLVRIFDCHNLQFTEDRIFFKKDVAHS